MKIREARPSEHDTLVDIWLRSVRATHAFLTENDIESLLPLVQGGALAELEMWVLESDDGTPAGFMGLDGTTVEALFLAPELLGQGGGKMLIDHARRLKGGPLRVDVNEQNPSAVGFYQRCGFTIIGRSEVDTAGRPFPLLHMREGAAVGVV